MRDMEEKGIIWFGDGKGQVFKGLLVDYDHAASTFWVQASRECPPQMDVVVILKNGEVFPSGKVEWCGKVRRVGDGTKLDQPLGYFFLRLEACS